MTNDMMILRPLVEIERETEISPGDRFSGETRTLIFCGR